MMVANPVAVRELRSAFRSRRVLMLAGVALAVMTGLVAFLWPERGVYSLQAQASRALVVSFAVALIGTVLVAVPAFAAAALVSERENRSWELLLASRLTPWRIVLGKLWASTGILLCFVVLSFPFLSAAFVLGALSMAEAFRLYAMVCLTALCAGVLGLAISAGASSTHSALVRAFAGMAAWAGLPWVVYALLRDIPQAADIAHGVLAFSPVAAVMSALYEQGAGISVLGLELWALYAVMVTGIGFLVFLGLVVAMYRRRPSARFGPDRVIDTARELQRRRRRFPFYLIDPQRRRRGLSDWGNPVFGRELRGRTLSGIWVFRAMVACFAVSAVVVIVLSGVAAERSPDGIKAFALAFQIGLLLLVAPALTCGAVAQERENRQWDLLRMSRLGPGALLDGKIRVALLFVALLLVGCIPLWWVIVVMELNTPAELGRSWAVIGCTLAVGLNAGLATSAFVRRTSAAAGWAYGILFCVAVLTLFPHLAPDRFTPALHAMLTTANPFIMAFRVLQSEGTGPVRAAWIRHLGFMGGLALFLGVLAYVRTRWIYRPDR